MAPSSLTDLPKNWLASMKKAGLESPLDILLHSPLRYEDWQQVCPIAQLEDGATVLVEGEIINAQVIPMRQRRHLLVVLTDVAGDQLTLRFFRVTPGLQHSMTVGRSLRARGQVQRGRHGWEMAHPKLQSTSAEKQIVAIYPAIKGLTSAQIQKLIAHLLVTARWSPTVPTPFARQLLPHHQPTTSQALAAIQTPSPTDGISRLPDDHWAWRWLRFEELLAHQIILRRRYHWRGHQAPPLKPESGWDAGLKAVLPFDLTNAQQRVLQEITDNLAVDVPMRRLLQGDVGSGKTVVAAYACLMAVRSGYTAAFMAPTEILAEQHYQTLSDWFAPIRVHCELITGAIKGKRRAEAINRLHFGISSIAIGTHTLFQEDILLPKLAVAIIDEQHRFGVEQRRLLTEKGRGTHQLMMSATPIPRTLALGLYADMDISVLDEKPARCQPVRTVLIASSRRSELLTRIADHIQNGGCIYWVCALVEESADSDLVDVQTRAKEIAQAYPTVTVDIIHGRMKATEKRAVMEAFRQGKFKVLVATTVIEVGVDVPQADVMVIERADRMGLSQLHQLRGRVGRGERAGVCLLMYQEPLSADSRQRLRAMHSSHDGFRIAQLDLALRGPGEWLGSRQSGIPALRVARLGQDDDIVAIARQAADWMLQHDKKACIRHVHRWLGKHVTRRAPDNT